MAGRNVNLTRIPFYPKHVRVCRRENTIELRFFEYERGKGPYKKKTLQYQVLYKLSNRAARELGEALIKSTNSRSRYD